MNDHIWTVGQEVLITANRDNENIVKIESVSRGRAFIGGCRFRADGTEIRDRGDRSWWSTRIRPATDEDRRRISDKKRLRDARAKIRDIRWDDQPIDVLDRVLAIVGSAP